KNTFDSRPPFTSASGVPGAPDNTVAERYDERPSYVGFSVPVALAWLHLDISGGSSFANIKKPERDDVGKWPEPVVPTTVVNAAREGVITVPVDSAIQRQPLEEGRTSYELLHNPP